MGNRQKMRSRQKGLSPLASRLSPLACYASSLFFFILALMSKPMAVSLPVVLLILDWYPFGRVMSMKTFRKALVEKLPFIALGIVSSVLTVLAQKSGGAMGLMESVALPARLLVAAKSLVIYLLHILFPANLLFFYPYPKDISFLSGDYFISVLSVTGTTAVCLSLVRKSRLWLSVWAYYLVTLLPVLGIVQVGMQARADRYTYLPGIGPSLLLGLALAWVFTRAAASGKRQVITAGLVGASGLLLVYLSATTIRQISVWKDSITLWSSIIAKEPERAFFAFHNRGIAFSRLGEYDKAIEDYRMAIALRPEYADTYSNLGIALLKKGFSEEAIRNYRIAITLNPGLVNAHRNLAVALFTSGRFSEALEHYLIVAGLRPEDAGAQNDLGSVYGAMGAYEKAIEHFQTALRLRPDLADAHYNLAMAFRAIGRMQEAQEHFDAALRNQ